MPSKFDQAVKVHQILGEPAEDYQGAHAQKQERNFWRRLIDRAKLTARSLIDRDSENPPIEDELDQRIDDHVLTPNRQAIIKRTINQERWLADHGFKQGQPIRIAKTHRNIRHHNNSFELPIGRPTLRNNCQLADNFLVSEILKKVSKKTSVCSIGQIEIIPGFILLELPNGAFSGNPDELSGKEKMREACNSNHFHHAIANLRVGPLIIMTRDISGERLSHLLLKELTHELISLSFYSHLHSHLTPNDLLDNPNCILTYLPSRSLTLRVIDSGEQAGDLLSTCLVGRQATYDSIDKISHQNLAERVRHLPHSCHSHPRFTLNDLGFTPHDWVPISKSHYHENQFRNVATNYLATLLLGKAMISALNDHPDAVETAEYLPAHALAEIECKDFRHDHYRAGDRYLNFIRSHHELNSRALDDIYHRSIHPELDFAHSCIAPHPIRLHTYQQLTTDH